MPDDRAEEDWAETGARIDTLLSGFTGPLAQERAEELVRLVTDLYGAGLEKRGALTGDVLSAISGDGLVSAFLLVHDLHPAEPATRIGKALSAMSGVSLVGVSGDVATVRLTGHGCGLRQAVSDAVEAAAPEIDLLFDDPGANLHYRAVPNRYRAVSFSLDVPVGLYFVFYNSTSREAVVCYPGPAGATESSLASGVSLPDVQPDVEALVVHEDDAFVVPIDACYELTGRLRQVWRGFDGGREAREEISRFFTRVRERSAT